MQLDHASGHVPGTPLGSVVDEGGRKAMAHLQPARVHAVGDADIDRALQGCASLGTHA